jgi:hypothetical protein
MLHKVGKALEILEEDMTVDKLMAGPEHTMPKNVADEE